ncbi:GyrI-like domain-containing protein [Vibrio vulnificus]|uniref:GyrI-like domain-containing protein n=1 Tax=Vibrio vulnificus TaxID=672 RepID=UPI001CDCD728|nr:GyrI-like domain-containing protein [Vibrio vulnificus]MCU8417596.1 GyrI-like domain-containing protein [Vibrio vulnificus]MDK2609387.1 GyrI-like domain-containing protein [Vibrio vulnificus]MDK2613840.1 GyrI-like domain-containing protein [Vibrio vulnificus]MDK2631514.1 GyrI-like domain-containing protein [Vibrio vulnificus]MDK2706863.1 GyrI-like domain-containing protein [Vibrio vulnificus]
MEVVEVKGFEIQGLILRTRNEIEMNPETANIPKHVEYVDSNLVIDYQSGARAYSVYCNYESDVNGSFDVLMGSNEVSSSNLELSSVSVVSGSYLKFESEGEFPTAVIAAWQSFGLTLALRIVRMKGHIQQILSITKVLLKSVSTSR